MALENNKKKLKIFKWPHYKFITKKKLKQSTNRHGVKIILYYLKDFHKYYLIHHL